MRCMSFLRHISKGHQQLTRCVRMLSLHGDMWPQPVELACMCAGKSHHIASWVVRRLSCQCLCTECLPYVQVLHDDIKEALEAYTTALESAGRLLQERSGAAEA